MNRKGELSNKSESIVAINFESVFNNKPSLKERLFGVTLEGRFVEEYKELTYKLYKAGFNVYITSFNDISEYEDKLWGRYLFFNNIVTHKNMLDLMWDCRNVYSYYIDDVNNISLLPNAYTLERFKELL